MDIIKSGALVESLLRATEVGHIKDLASHITDTVFSANADKAADLKEEAPHSLDIVKGELEKFRLAIEARTEISFEGCSDFELFTYVVRPLVLGQVQRVLYSDEH